MMWRSISAPAGPHLTTMPGSGSRPTSTSFARRSATASIARCSIRSIRSCARSVASPNTSSTPVRRRRAAASLYVSNHKSHLDYLVEPLVLDDNGIRPPVRRGRHQSLRRAARPAASARHRRDPDPAQQQGPGLPGDAPRVHRGAPESPGSALLRGGWSQLQRRLQSAQDRLAPGRTAGRPRPPCPSCRWRWPTISSSKSASSRAKRRAVAVARSPRKWRRWSGTRSATSRARSSPSAGRFRLADYDPESRRDLVSLTHRVHDAVGLLHKVLPTALVAAAMRPGSLDADLVGRVGRAPGGACARRARTWRSVRHGRRRRRPRAARRTRDRRGRIPAGPRVRVRDRVVLRYYARTIQHLLHRPQDHALMIAALSESDVFDSRRQPHAQEARLPLRHAAERLRAPFRRRRDHRRSHRVRDPPSSGRA